LHLADNALILGQRNAEWCGHARSLEEDIALSNVSLDLIGQARLLNQLVATLKGGDCTGRQARLLPRHARIPQLTLSRTPHHGPLSGYAHSSLDYGTTIVRNFLYSALMALLWEALEKIGHADLAAIAAKSVRKCATTCAMPATGWFASATAPTNRIPRSGVARPPVSLYPGILGAEPGRSRCHRGRIGVDLATLKADWDAIVDAALAEATFAAAGGRRLRHPRAEEGIHSEASRLPAGRNAKSGPRPSERRLVSEAHERRSGLGRAGGTDRSGNSGHFRRELGNHCAMCGRRRWSEVVIYADLQRLPGDGQIEDDVRATLARAGIAARVVTQLAPAWSTDWMTRPARKNCAPTASPRRTRPGGRNVVRSSASRPPRKPCPVRIAARARTVESSHFGSTACKGSTSASIARSRSTTSSLISEASLMSAPRFHELTIKRVTPEAAGSVAITFDIPAAARDTFAIPARPVS
jgi:ring-1,2-phenylacetyl-CoA epoxidase subunit PaaC